MEINNLQPEQLLSDSTNKNLVGKYSENSHKKIKCVCDFKNAEDCLGIVSREYRDFLKTYKNNNNKYICFRCSRATKYQSEKNPNKKFHYNIDFNNYNSDSNVAYLLGWIASDGTVSHKTGSISLKIKKDDEEILNYFIKTFKLNSLIKYDKNIEVGELYQHTNGNKYRILNKSIHTEFGSKLITYQNIDDPDKIWSRPIHLFKNFTKIEES